MASLVKQIDKIVADNTDKKMSAFVNFLGEDREALEEAATKFIDANKITHVPVVVPVEFEFGPDNIGINPKAGVTVMIYKGLTVVANHAIPSGKLDKAAIKAIIKDTAKILN